MAETFTPIPGFEKYGVSESGRVKNLKTQNILIPYTYGSCKIAEFWIDGKRYRKSLNKLVNLVYGKAPDGFYPIAGYESKYFINKQGKIFSLAKGRYITPVVGGGGAIQVCFSKDGIQGGKYVGRLVWETFKGEIPKGKHIVHKDGDFTNNSLDNLDVRKRYTLTEKQVQDLVKRIAETGYSKRGNTLVRLAGKYGVSRATVQNVFKEITGSYSLRKSKI